MTPKLSEDAALLKKEWPLWRKFELPDGATVVVAGAYQGKVMELLCHEFPGIHCVGFEPQQWATLEAMKRLEGTGYNWEIYPVALGEQRAVLPLGEYYTDACSFIINTREKGEGHMVEWGRTMERCHIGPIDLFVCNMEGYEFKLLPYLAAENYLKDIRALAIQWHIDLAPGWNQEWVDSFIEGLTEYGYELRVDQRPAWSYHVRPRGMAAPA